MAGASEREFTEFVLSRWQALFRTAVFLGCRPEEAEDLVQSALTRCLLKWGKVRAARDRDAYVYSVMLNCLRDSKRRHWKTEDPSNPTPEESMCDPSEQVAIADAVHRGLAGLSEEHRRVLVLRYFADLTEDQVATVLDLPPGTVKSRLSRARAHLATDPDLIVLRKGEP